MCISHLKERGVVAKKHISIGLKSDHWLPISVTHSLTKCCFVDLIDVPLAREDAIPKVGEIVIVANAETLVDDRGERE